MKSKFIILCLSLLLITFFSYAQDTSIVSLNKGNKWYYHYIFQHSLYGTENKLEIKEVVGDTIIGNKAYKKIFVISQGNDTTTRMQFWGVDSVKFFFKDLEIVGWELNTFYDVRILHDTIFFFSGGFPTEEYGMKLDTFYIWNETKNTQRWYEYTDYLVSHYSSHVQTVFGIGPVEIRSSSSGEYETKNKTNTLIGALIDGAFYGDSVVTDVFDNDGTYLIKYLLSQNYPNPFNPNTKIQFQIPQQSFVTLKIYDVLGNEIAILVNKEKPAGEYEVNFGGANLPSGIYFYQLSAGDYVLTKKMVLIK
jgi:hypothetical protein